MADAEKRLSAISLVEGMLSEVGGRGARYREMSQEDAMRQALRTAGQRMNSSELADELKRGGYPFTSGNPANSIVVAANSNRRGYFATEKEGNRTLIGLKEWGPENEPDDPFRDEDG